MTKTAALSESVKWRLVTMLYTQTSTLIAGGAGLLGVAVTDWYQTRQAWCAVWALAITILLVVRVIFDKLFISRGARDSAAVWDARYVVGAWAMGILCGTAALSIVFNISPILQLLTLSAQTAIIMGGATRNASSPKAAKGQIILGFVPTIAACFATRDWHYIQLSAAPIIEVLAALQLTKSVHSQTVGFLCIQEENLALVNEIKLANGELGEANRLLEVVATTDALTGIANRRRYDEVLREELARARRDATDLSVLLLDIDKFKSFNDLYGHPEGDACLRSVAQTFAAVIRRPADFVARYGGEEFVAVLPRTDAAGAAVLAESVRAAVEALKIDHAAGATHYVTVSIGVASLYTNCFAQDGDLLRAADNALYAAKGSGRNQVRVAALTETDEPSIAPQGAAA